MVNMLNLIANILSVISILIISYGALIAIINFLRGEIKRDASPLTALTTVRTTLGSYLLLGLEILIAADILKTILEPSYRELIVLGSVVLIRTVLSFFLNREISELSARSEAVNKVTTPEIVIIDNIVKDEIKPEEEKADK
ncbi:DUF1622 domain-containing protein [Pragia fontium]|uniref:Uncharacterized membrane protein n=2 Tax=Pragia fontium TaxID=82985 RepID=A0AAJ5BGT6_9GAMM|nr:DUF1622 domain-containing protein [Pragia fontium]GKX63412.1 hypothetical protein SOASR032_19810 [Pragia fontium]SFC63082.1 Uncharacterized membrane protein [Pragia fontium DSM 5563 = ATCC 49100]